MVFRKCTVHSGWQWWEMGEGVERVEARVCHGRGDEGSCRRLGYHLDILQVFTSDPCGLLSTATASLYRSFSSPGGVEGGWGIALRAQEF